MPRLGPRTVRESTQPAIVLIQIAIVATAVPARRSIRVDPLAALLAD